MISNDDWVKWGTENRLVGNDYFLSGATSQRIRDQQLQHEYYIGDQVMSYSDARLIYSEMRARGVDDISPYLPFPKIGPYFSELKDDVCGRIRFEDRMPAFFPLTKRIIDILGCTYATAPKRHFIFKKNENKLSSDIYTEFISLFLPHGFVGIDSLMTKIECYSLLHGVAGLLIDFKKDGISKIVNNIGYSNGYCVFTPLLAHNLFISLDEFGELQAINYVYGSQDYGVSETIDYSRVITKESDILISHKHSKNTTEKDVKIDVNPLGFIPALFMNDDLYPSTESFWGHGLGSALVYINRALNDFLAQEQSLIRDQTQQRLFFINFKEVPEHSLGTGAITMLDDRSPDKDQGRVEKISPSADIAAVRQSIEAIFKRAAYSFGLPTEILQTNSSKAIAEARGELKPHYLKSQKKCAIFEKKLWNMIFKVISYYATQHFTRNQISLDDVVVDFEPWPTQNLGEMISLAQFMLVDSSQNPSGRPLGTPSEVRRMLFSVSETEAEQKEQESIKFWKEYQEANSNDNGGFHGEGTGQFPSSRKESGTEDGSTDQRTTNTIDTVNSATK